MQYPDMTQAKCQGLDTELFFGVSKKEIAQAKKLLEPICLTCPIMEKCLEYALHVKVEGIWAGTDETDRRHLRKERGIVGIAIADQYEFDFFLSQDPEAVARRKARANKSAETRRALQELEACS